MKPKDGKEVTQEEFDKIIAEKAEEHKKEMEAREKKRAAGGGHRDGHGRR